MALPTCVGGLNASIIPIPNVGGRQTLADMLRSWELSGVAGGAVGDASAATFTWTTDKVVGVSYAAGTCTITLPNETDLISWPVDEARTLLKLNTSVNVIAFAQLTNVSFNFAAVNTAITTLVNSAVVPGIATRLPRWTIWRRSATSYLFLEC